MKGKSFLKMFGIGASVVFVVCLLTGSSIAAPIKLSYASWGPPIGFISVQMERWKKVVEKKTAGKVLINTYPGGSLLNAKGIMDGVIMGQADIGVLCTAYQPGRFIVSNAISLPFGFENATVASLTLWDLYMKYNPKELSTVKVLTMFTCAPANIMSKVPVRNLQDLKGLELRCSGGVSQVLKILGAVPVAMPNSETAEALQKGVVQGAVTSLETLMDGRFAETCRYATIFNGPVYAFAVVMNIKKWKALPKDVQEVMDNLRSEQCLWTGNYMDKHVEESISWSKKNYNLEIIELSKEQLSKWNALLKPISKKWIEGVKKKGLPAEAIIEDIRAFKKRNARF